MSSVAVVGTLVIVGAGVVYGLWVRARLSAPFDDEPAALDHDTAVRFLGTAVHDRRVATWPRGELTVDAQVAVVRFGGDPDDDVVVRRAACRRVVIDGGRLARRVVFEGKAGPVVAGLRFGAALADPAPALTRLGWPVETR